MQILAHRGCWQHPSEKNSRSALKTAFHSKIGVETDIRDFNGRLIISHDIPGADALPLEYMLEDFMAEAQPGYLALNIKADGLTGELQSLLGTYGVTRYFCFDMSVPDTIPYLNAGMNVAARLSEYEQPGLLTELAQTIWLDNFHHSDINPALLEHYLSTGKAVCLVSPELHGRDSLPMWNTLANFPLLHHPNLFLCTDFPIRARRMLA